MKPELIRIKIAGAVGLTVIDVPFAPATVNCHATGVFFTSAAWSEWVKVYRGGARTLPRYEEDLNAAVTLCDVLAGEGWGWEMRQARDKAWRCILHKRVSSENVLFSRVHTSDELEHLAPTLAEAICGAFLRVKGLWTEDTATV